MNELLRSASAVDCLASAISSTSDHGPIQRLRQPPERCPSKATQTIVKIADQMLLNISFVLLRSACKQFRLEASDLPFPQQ
jgi:hypothetical protein